MNLIWRWPLSILFVVINALAMLVHGIVFLPWALVSSDGARAAAGSYARFVLFTARVMIGLKSEVRGEVPEGECIVVSKHQSFLDVLMLFNALERPKFIMKRELLWTPVLGLYAWRLGCVPVKRGDRSAAIRQMMADVASGRIGAGQLIIYPQGTRVAPGETRPYKIGSYALYEQLGQRCVPAATNAGLFWRKGTMLRQPGTGVVEFLSPIEPGMERKPFMAYLEQEIEDHSNRLMQEAGFDALPKDRDA